MRTSSLEITGQEYLIRLNKDDFDLSFINQLLKRIQSEQSFFSRNAFMEMEEDIISRNAEADTPWHDNLDDK
ncbi:hypothetical protein [Hufsiella ginkgonis]|uniref:Uncharacterized protein n=1 Tax=Hufsiella ginkgonis TaxID=2695274 RepID=A0A7K1XZE0_9SPHI|nr:hypothetical protein [Hufsiella ginkgonis]MXV15916.1 hypothetical protein [Hufsiella ginkgonis]